MSNDLANLEAYYNTPSFLELTGKERLEEVHSNMLAWFFNEPEFRKYEVIKRFLNLVLSWAEKESLNIDSEFKKAIYTNSIIINDNYEVIREERITTPSYGVGMIDIVIKCNCQYNNSERKLNIILENKVYASETKKSKDKDMNQTDAYYEYYSSNHNSDINIFVFLKPITTYELCQQISSNNLQEWRKCQNFIVINYQELLSNIIEPIKEISTISERNFFILREYIKSLGKTKKCNKVMGYSKEEKDLLLKFYENHKDLISAVMTVIQDDSDTPDEIKETAKNYNEAVSKYAQYFIKWKDKNSNIISKEGLSMVNFAKEFALYLLDKSKSAEDIDSIFKELTESSGFFFTDKKNGKEKYHLIEIVYENNTYFLQRDWRYSGKSGFFSKFIKNIKNNDNYNDFEFKESYS